MPKHKRKGERVVPAHKQPPSKKGPGAAADKMAVEKAAEPAAQKESDDVDMAEGDPNKILFLQRLPHEVRPPSLLSLQVLEGP